MTEQTAHALASAWDHRPPPAQPTGIEVLWPRPKQQLCGWIITSHMEGVYTHYHFGRSLPCIGRDNGCEYCGPRSSRRWQGYIGIYDRRQSRVCIAQITKEAARNCPSLSEPTESLRGKYLVLERVGEARNAPVVARVETRPSVPELPAPIDVRHVLSIVWGFHPAVAGFQVPRQGEEGGEA